MCAYPRNEVAIFTPNVIVKTAFYTPSSKNRAGKASNKVGSEAQGANATFKAGGWRSAIDYGARKTSAVLWQKRQHASYTDYFSQDFKVESRGVFTREATYASGKDFERMAEQNAHLGSVPEESLIWDMIISFSQSFYLNHQITSKSIAAELVRDNIDTLLVANNISPSSIEYVGQFHVDTPSHFHVHLRLHQTRHGTYDARLARDVWRRRGKLSERSYQIFKARIEEGVMARTKTRQAFNLRYLGARDDVVLAVKEGFNEAQDIKPLRILASNVKALLPATGRTQYQSANLSTAAKRAVDELVGALIASNETARIAGTALNNSLDELVTADDAAAFNATNEMLADELAQLVTPKKQEAWTHLANQAIKLVKGASGISRERLNTQYSPRVGQIQTKRQTQSFQRFGSDANLQVISRHAQHDVEAMARTISRNVRAQIRQNQRGR